MRGRAVICALLFLCAPRQGPAADFSIQGEYRHDALDYESEERDFYRVKASAFFSKESAMYASAVCRQKISESSYTWCLVLGDASPFLRLYAGHYRAGFGSGLLLGHRTAYNPDPFSRRESSGVEDPFAPVKSGNPAYAFRGAALSAIVPLGPLSLSAHPFFSIHSAHLNEDGYYSGATGSSLETLSNSKRDRTHTEPVSLRTLGSTVSLNAPYTLLSFCCVYTDLRTQADKVLRFDAEESHGRVRSIRALDGAGAFARYSDGCLTLFFEAAASVRKMSGSGGNGRDLRGYGALGGVRFSHPLLSLSVIRKESGRDFYAPFGGSIGESYPERGWFADARVRLIDSLAVGGSVSAERKLRIDSGDEERPFTLREQVYARFSNSWVRMLQLSAKIMEKKEGNERRHKEQYVLAGELAPAGPLLVQCQAIYQHSSSARDSLLAGAGVKITLFGYCTLRLHYARGFITGGNPIYTVIAPADGANIPGFFVKRNSDILASKFTLRYEPLSLSCRYLHEFSGGRTQERRLEIAGGGIF